MDQAADQNSQGIENYAQLVQAQETSETFQVSDDLIKYLCKVIEDLEKSKGSPPTLTDCRKAFVMNPGPHAAVLPLNRNIFHVCWKKDAYYLDQTGSYFSLQKWNDNYFKYTEKFETRFKPFGYKIGDRERMRATESAKTVEFTELWDILTSSDEQKLKDNEWIFSDIKNPHFLKMGSEVNVASTGNHVGFLSYPRCGNSFLRKYLANITGTQTGSDMGIDMGLHAHQQLAEFLGEHIVDESVWIKKSHDPMFLPGSLINKVNKVICCVRNPYDVMVSMTHFMSGSMGGQLAEDFAKDTPHLWNENIRMLTDTINAYHSHMMLEISEHVPVYYVRYEDLLLEPQATLESLWCFILNRESIEGLNIQKRIKAVVEMGHKSTVTYTQKVDWDNLNKADSQIAEKKFLFNRNIDQYNAEQQEYVSTESKDFFEIFGYCSKMADGEQELDRFQVSEAWLTEQQTKCNFAKYGEINKEQFRSFEKLNAQAMAQVIELAKEDKLKDKVYICNADPEQQVKIPFTPDILGKWLMTTNLKEKPQIKKE